MEHNGAFIISLDFELFWGVRDKETMKNYGTRISAVHQIIPRLLERFTQYDVRATFSTVGFLFYGSKDELVKNLPSRLPRYNNPNLSPYNGHIDALHDNTSKDLYHFAPDLIKAILNHPKQEIGTHTFSHYYCLEPGQSIDEFEADIKQAIAIGKANDTEISSLVFPRNQFNKEYIDMIKKHGIICYRGNEKSWLYTAKNTINESLIRRAFRLVDAYINVSGHNCYTHESLKNQMPINIPSSRFLRPYMKKLRLLEPMRINRILKGMTHAAKNNLVYHLWWHPHNFGADVEENFKILEQILEHYNFLNKKYQFQSNTMSELAKKIMTP